jgi:hypothetical protein
MLTRLDRIVIWLGTIVVVPGLVFPIATIAPIMERCTLRVTDALAHAEAVDRRPPPAIVKAIFDDDLRRRLAVESFSGSRPPKQDFGFLAARWAFFEGCNGPPQMNLGWRFLMIPTGWWMHARFSEEDLVSLHVSRAYMGNKVHGFAAASRHYFGREVTELNGDELRCLVRRARGYYPGQTCNMR